MRIGDGDGVLVCGLHALNVVNAGAGHILGVAVHEIQVLFHCLGVKGCAVMEGDSLAERQRHHRPVLIERIGFGQIALDLSILIFQKGFVEHGTHGVVINTHVKRGQRGCLGHGCDGKRFVLGVVSALAAGCGGGRIAVGRPAAGAQHHAEAERR